MRSKNMFLYEILLNLFNYDIENISVEELLNIHPILINQLKNYNLDYYYKKFKNPKKFIFNTILVFSNFELGIYKNHILTFYKEAILLKNPLKYNLDINNKLIHEISLYLKYALIENKPNLKTK
jgi:hypothetical protein